MSHVQLLTITVDITATEYGLDNVTVSIDWNQEVGVSYNISTFPSATITFKRSTGAELTVAYNIEYILKLQANTSCRNNATASLVLNYGELAIYPKPVIKI